MILKVSWWRGVSYRKSKSGREGTEEAKKEEKGTEVSGDTIIEFCPPTLVPNFLSATQRNRARIHSHLTTDFGSQELEAGRD